MAEERRFKGIAVAPGISIAPAYLYTRAQSEAEERQLSVDEVTEEIERLSNALERSEKQLQKITSVAREKLGEESASIFEAQNMMLRDEMVHDEILECIQRKRCNAAFAVQTVLEKHRMILEASNNVYWKERAHDLLDVQDRILHNLNRRKLVSAIDNDRIVVAKNLSAADVILFSRREIKGCLLDFGGATSHVSIVARALGVPAVVSVGWKTEKEVRPEDALILDGFTGTVIVNPGPETIAEYQVRQHRYELLLEEQKRDAGLGAETTDGQVITLRANIDVQEELSRVTADGGQGIGLLRTEMIYLLTGRPLTEDEQFDYYKRTVNAVSPYVTTIRLIDLGGDKMLPMGHHEHNPFLGWRGVRILLERPELLQPQIRAILRVAAFGEVRMMVPMVTTLKEVRLLKDLVTQARIGLEREGVAIGPCPIGIMVEVPAVAIRADIFAREVDFFSIGTNDLTQYTLAVDRGSDLVAGLFDEFNPAVLKLIAQTVRHADAAGIPVSICGEMASRPEAVPLLIGLGVRELSASPVFLPMMKRVIRHLDTTEAAELARVALACRDTSEVHQKVETWFAEKEVDLASLLH